MTAIPVPQDRLYESREGSLLGAAIPMTICTVVALVGRFYAKSLTKSALWWDDYFIIAAQIVFAALVSIYFTAIDRWGLGTHYQTLSPATTVHFNKALIAYQIHYFTCQTLIKLSLLCLYWRLFKPFRNFRIACFVVSGIVIGWFIAVVLVAVLGCNPVRAFWDTSLDPATHCISLLQFAYGNGISNLLLDVMVLALPFPMLFQLQLNSRAKVSLACIFALGFFVCAVSIIRITSIAGYARNLADPTWSLAPIWMWSVVEPACAMIGASLPVMRPIFARFLSLSSSKGTSQGYGTGNGHSNGQKTPTIMSRNGTNKKSARNTIHGSAFAGVDEELGDEIRLVNVNGGIGMNGKGDAMGVDTSVHAMPMSHTRGSDDKKREDTDGESRGETSESSFDHGIMVHTTIEQH